MITLTLKTGKEVRVNQAFVDSIFCGQGGTGAFIGLAGDAESQMEVKETPEQIADMVAAAKREARIRENAARLLAAFIVSGSELESTILHGVSGQHALSLERRLDEFFAAERAAKKTGEE